MHFIYIFILFYIAYAVGQCISSNEVTSNEGNVGETTRSLTEGSISFSLDLLKALQKQDQNSASSSGIFFSPFSIWSALMLTFMGSNKQTEKQMRQVLHIGDSDKLTAWEAYRNIYNWNLLRHVQSKENFLIANKIYFQNGTKLQDCIREYIESEHDYVDFANDPTGARDAINSWVETQTKQKILDFLPQNSISPLTKMVIANAVYFKESWLQQFDSAKTKKRPFTLASRKETKVDMMTVKGSFYYGYSQEMKCTAVELPYEGDGLSMVVLLPRNKYYGVGVLANRLTPERLQNLIDGMYLREVMVSIPKFRSDNSIELRSVLSKMGLTTLFDSRLVNLSNFTEANDLTVDSVHHKSFINVNEEGTEAAAATGIIANRARALSPATFTANYPFIFFIRESMSNLILFAGTVRNPQKTV